MEWFNYFGLVIMVVIMIPNIIYAAAHKDDLANAYNNKVALILEQIGRYGCFVLMIFNIPYTYFNFWFSHAYIVYISVNGALLLAYIISWIVLFNEKTKLKALLLSILPSCIFIFSGIMLASIPLIVFAVIFTIFHILISYKNTVTTTRRKRPTIKQKLEDEAITILVAIIVITAVVCYFLHGGV